MRARSLLVLFAAGILACNNGASSPEGQRTTPAEPVSEPAGGGGAADSEGGECRLVREGHGPAGQISIRTEIVARGLEVPWAIAFLPGSDDWLVTERPGRIRLVRDGRLQPDAVATVDLVDRGEGGLLGIAAHPDFADNRWFYIYYTARTDDGIRNRIERWHLAADHRSARADQVIFDDIPAARFHNGGRLRFGPDGMLYASTGDASQPDLSQDHQSAAGAILRLRPDGSIPADNPWPDSPVFVTGIRNAQAFDWPDPETLYIADHGPSGDMGRTGHDEIHVASAGDNLGWPAIYGCQDRSGMLAPRLSWVEATPPGGAAIYTGEAISAWSGDFIVGILGARHLHQVSFDDGSLESHAVYLPGDPPEGHGRLREVIMGPDGELYVTTSNCDGRGNCPDDGDRIVRVTR